MHHGLSKLDHPIEMFMQVYVILAICIIVFAIIDKNTIKETRNELVLGFLVTLFLGVYFKFLLLF